MSPTLNVKLALFVIPCKFLDVIDLRCCNYCHLLIDISAKRHSTMTILVKYSLKNIIRKVITYNDMDYHMKPITIFSVQSLGLKIKEYPGISCGILSIPHNNVMDLSNGVGS